MSQTKPQIALDQIAAAKARGDAPGVILADAGYGADGGFGAGLSALGLAYVVGVQPTLSVCHPGDGPLPAKPWSGGGRPPSLLRCSADRKPVSVNALAEQVDAKTWQTVRWRERTNVDLASRFAAVRSEPRAEERLDTTASTMGIMRRALAEAAHHAVHRRGSTARTLVASTSTPFWPASSRGDRRDQRRPSGKRCHRG